MSSSSTYSGDVTLNGDEEPPVKITSPENVHVKTGAIDSNLKVRNAEFVYTNTPAGDSVTVDSITTEISGTLEDGYIEKDSVDGDVVIEDAEDVFIEHNAVSGGLQIVGDEQRFHDASDTEPIPRPQYDDSVTGWKRSLTVTDPSTGVSVVGGRNEVRVTDSTQDFDLYITGWNNTVEINGKANTVTVHFIGAKNSVSAGSYTDVNVATDSGHDNSVTIEEFPVDDLIQTTKKEAYGSRFFGREKITYQEPAVDEDYCPGCGASSDAIIRRRQSDVFFLFGFAIYHFDNGGSAYECEECSRNASPAVELSESERKELFR